MSPALNAFVARLDYRFDRDELLQLALTHRSAANQHNERLEFLGDAILGFVIADELYQRFPEADEGQMSRLRALLVKGKTLAELATGLGFSEVLNLGEGELKSGGFRRDSILADAFEAVIGAIYLDAGLTAARKKILDWYQVRLDSISLNDALKDPKTQLQEWLQSNQLPLPDYQLLKSEGKDHNRKFWIECVVAAKNIVGEGVGTSKRKAEQAAAKSALEKLLNEQ